MSTKDKTYIVYFAGRNIFFYDFYFMFTNILYTTYCYDSFYLLNIFNVHWRRAHRLYLTYIISVNYL